jgi:hypothetical protein
LLNSNVREIHPERNRPTLIDRSAGHESLNFEKSDGIIGRSRKMQQIFKLVKRVARSDSTVDHKWGERVWQRHDRPGNSRKFQPEGRSLSSP